MAFILCEYTRIRFETISQLRYVPMARPSAVQVGCASPVSIASPGRPISSHELISDASALIAVTNGPSRLPPR